MLHSPWLKYHVHTIGIDQYLNKNTLKTTKIYTNKLVSVMTSKKSKILLRLLWFILLKDSPTTVLYLPLHQHQPSITSYIDLQNGCFLLAMFSMSTFIVSWYYKSCLSSFIVTTMSLFLSLTLFVSEFTSASSLVSSATFSSSSCNKIGFYPSYWNWLFHCMSSYTSLLFINNWCFLTESICI